MIVLDTNVVSEIMQGAGSSPVLAWVIAQAADDLAITAVTVMEMSDGIARMQPGRRRDQLRGAVGHARGAVARHVPPDGPAGCANAFVLGDID